MKEEDKKDAEELIKYLQDNSNAFSKKGDEKFPWLKSDKGKKARIINELASKGIFDKECVKTGRPKLDKAGWEYFNPPKKEVGNTYNFRDNTVFQSEIKDSSVIQSSDRLRSNSRINKTNKTNVQNPPPKKVGAETIYWVVAIISGIFLILGYLNDWFGIFE